jgi:hypothetical protein
MSDLEQLKKNLVYKLKAQDIGLASWKGSHGRPEKMFIPTKDYLLSSATKQQDAIQKRNEMMEEYLDEQRTPIIRYDEDGDPIEYKFHAIDPPELNLTPLRIDLYDPETRTQHVADIPLENQRVILRDEKRIISDKERILDSNIADYTADFENNNQEIQRADNEIQEISAVIKELHSIPNLPNRKNIVKANQREITLLKREKSLRIKQNIDIKNLIESTLKEKTQYRDDIERIVSQIKNTLKQNESKVKAYQEELNALNSGQLNTSKGFDETDEEYLARLQQMADIPFADGRTEERALIRLKNKLRENLKLIVRSNSVIDQVVNDIYSNAPMLLNDINKYFPGFKDYFIKKFGENNDKITGRDIVTEITSYLQKATNPDIMRGIIPTSQEVIVRDQNRPFLPALSPEQLSSSNPTDVPGIRQLTNPNSPRSDSDEEYENVEFGTPIEQIEAITNILTEPVPFDVQLLDAKTTLLLRKGNKKIYIKMYKNPKSGKTIFFTSKTGMKGSFLECESKDIFSKITNIGITKDEIKNILNISDMRKLSNASLALKFETFINGTNGLIYTTETPFNAQEFSSGKATRELLGLGIKQSEDIPEKVQFGSNILLLKKLFLKNILSIQNKHNVKINGFNNVHVSDNFVKIIMNLIKNINFTNNDLQNLSGNERLLLDNLLMLSELNKQFVTGSSTDSLNKIKKDYEILIGEIQAGNNNDLLKKKLYHLLMKLVHFRALGFPTAIKHYKEIIKEYF